MIERLAHEFAFANEQPGQKFTISPRLSGDSAAAPWQTAGSHNHVSGACAYILLHTPHMTTLSIPRLTIVTASLLCAPASLGASAVRAQDASAWDKEAHAEARLIAGSVIKTSGASVVRAGIEIRLDPGWKTYWRQPGDSGVPPAFDFGGSENVNAVKVLWPAPERFPDGAGGNSIGYIGRIVLPLSVAPKDIAKPSTVHLKLSYAICGNLCVPAEATLELALSGDGAEEAAIEKADMRVPRQVAFGAAADFSIRSVHREPGGEHDRVTVEVAAPIDTKVELFVEGPTPDWSLPLPEPSGTFGDIRRFTFDLDGLPQGAKADGAVLTFTAVTNDDAIEVPVHLD
jgi:DsbC/DsbD-like thiol-disulfide interchange protein